MIKLVQDKRDNTRSQTCHHWMVRLHAESPLERNHNKAESERLLEALLQLQTRSEEILGMDRGLILLTTKSQGSKKENALYYGCL